MSKELFGVFGAGGCGRGVMPLAREHLEKNDIPLDRLVFIDDVLAGKVINGHDVLHSEQFFSKPAINQYVAIAIANSAMRQRIKVLCKSHDVQPWTVVASNAILMDDVSIGEGAVISPFVTMTSNIVIGSYFHANLYAYIEHDCVIGDFVTFAPGAKCNGNVHIEDNVYIGSGAIIKQGAPDKPIRIGCGAVIGMGAVVLEDVPPGATVVGNPARVLK